MKQSFLHFVLITFYIVFSIVIMCSAENVPIGSLPEGFTYLDQVDSTIIKEVMYFGDRNFAGERINGYKAPKIILTEKAALSLKLVQADIKNDNYSLIVYDAYRPVKAVKHFIRWSRASDEKMKQFYYPHIDKKDAFKLGYIAEKSGHSRGSTVDLSIVEIGKTVNSNWTTIKRELKDGRLIYYRNFNTVDMYSSIDLMDTVSWHDTTLIDETYQFRRNYLRDKMRKHGFQPYSREWWHYTLIDEPFKDQYFDFDIQ